MRRTVDGRLMRSLADTNLTRSSLRFGIAAVLLCAIGLRGIWYQPDDVPIRTFFHPAWCFPAGLMFALLGAGFAIASARRSHLIPAILGVLLMSLSPLLAFIGVMTWALWQSAA
jgi:hypothetical protein